MHEYAGFGAEITPCKIPRPDASCLASPPPANDWRTYRWIRGSCLACFYVMREDEECRCPAPELISYRRVFCLKSCGWQVLPRERTILSLLILFKPCCNNIMHLDIILYLQKLKRSNQLSTKAQPLEYQAHQARKGRSKFETTFMLESRDW